MSNDDLLGESNAPTTTPAADATTEAGTSAPAAAAPETTAAPVTESNYLANVSEDLRGSVEKFKNVDDLAKSYVNLEKMMGDSVRVPTSDATPDTKNAFFDKIKGLDEVLIKPRTQEGMDEFYNKLGRPEKASGYDHGASIPSELINDPATVTELSQFQDRAHALGLTQDQAKGMIDMRMEQYTQYKQGMTTSTEEGLATLHKQWGSDYDTRLKGAVQMKDQMKEKFPDQMAQLLATNGSNPALAHMLSELAFSYQEAGVVGQPKINYGMTPDQAAAKIGEKLSDQDFYSTYRNTQSAGHEAAVAELDMLYKVKHNVR